MKEYSVIIPVYNSGDALNRAILSIINQSYPATEIIIIDDGSTCNKTKNILEQLKLNYPDFIQIFWKANGGAASARNLGATYAKCEVLAFLDSDDCWECEKMKHQISVLVTNTNIYAVACLYKPLRRFTGLVSYNNILKITLGKQLLKNNIQTSTFIVYKQYFNLVNGFPEDQTHAEEGDLYFKILIYGPILLINFPFVIYGSGKHEFNSVGLSSNTKEMYHGEVLNLGRLLNRKQITKTAYIGVYLFSYMKYLLRKLTRNT